MQAIIILKVHDFTGCYSYMHVPKFHLHPVVLHDSQGPQNGKNPQCPSSSPVST